MPHDTENRYNENCPQRCHDSPADLAGWGLSDGAEEAIREAVEFNYGNTEARVPRPEHLVAIKLQAGRPRDLGHLQLLLEEANIDDAYLNDIMQRHGLLGRWCAFRKGGG